MTGDCGTGGDLTGVDGDIAFGASRARFAATLDDAGSVAAVTSLQGFFLRMDIESKRFLDIGCESGLFPLAACLPSAREVMALDIDRQSDTRIRAALSAHALSAARR